MHTDFKKLEDIDHKTVFLALMEILIKAQKQQQRVIKKTENVFTKHYLSII